MSQVTFTTVPRIPGGWVVYARGPRTVGLVILAAYALLGIASVGHYFVAPISSHSWPMNVTIIAEVGLAGLMLVLVALRFSRWTVRMLAE